ncbi:MAG: hypothetical protein KDE01_19005 [Caldilineaceae bacterium]|nr:hypothetical protein [Caldilineaceae bacterium]
MQAVLYRTLMAASDASAETRWLVNKVQDQDDETFVPSAEVKKWLDTVLDRLFGMR